MPNEVWQNVVIYGNGSHKVVDELYNQYSNYDGECAKNKTKLMGINEIEIGKITLYSNWNPIYEELVELSKTKKIWIRNTYSIEYGEACQGLIVIDNGNVLVNVEYYDYYDCSRIIPQN